VRIALFALLAGAAAAAALAQGPARATAERDACPLRRADAGHTRRVMRALAARQDVWGNALLAAPGGPTYERVRRLLPPLLLARAAKGRPLTDSGVHYVAFAQPLGNYGAGSVALHVADGSQVLTQRVDSRRLTVRVGPRGGERFGSCLARLATPRLAGGWLPILATRYVDGAGTRYGQESFAARATGDGSLTSYLRVTVDTRRSRRPTVVRFASGRRSLSYSVGAGGERTLYAAWRHHAMSPRLRAIDAGEYASGRAALIAYWERRLAQAATFDVPEQRVVDAQRNLLVQNLGLTWRYSIGNAYEQFSFPESVDNAQVLAAYGFPDVSRAILRTSLTRRPTPYPNWKMGQRLVAVAFHDRLWDDRAFVAQVTPNLARYVAALGRQLEASERRLLARERYSSDIPHSVYGLHSQAVAWHGLRSIGRVWAADGRDELAARSLRLAGRLEAGLRRAVRRSARRLPDGSLFVPARLLDDERPYASLTEARLGSYWNLVVPYALATGFFPPHHGDARGVLRYLLNHGSRFVGLVRAGAYALYRDPTYPTSGTDQVYGLQAARFLADNDRADELVLTLYGHLAAGMTPGTFVGGEAATLAPLDGAYYRSMYLPPNSASNAAFLETLRLLLVHETRDRKGGPRGLDLAFSTPRAWLAPGKRISVRAAPTSFGPLSYSLEAAARSVRATLEVPTRAPIRALRLRLRLPRPHRMTAVIVDGRPYARFDPRSETIDLSGRTGTLTLDVSYAPR
jgi:hypothetical protein